MILLSVNILCVTHTEQGARTHAHADTTQVNEPARVYTTNIKLKTWGMISITSCDLEIAYRSSDNNFMPIVEEDLETKRMPLTTP